MDGHIGYTGGFGLADYWLGDGHHDGQWRESNMRFEGPAVMQLQAAFSAAWAESTGELITGPLFFPPSGFQENDGVDAGLLYTAPTTGSTPAERFLALTMSGARKTLYITNSYFVPDDDFRHLLEKAVKRGVDVRILTVERQDRCQDDLVRRPLSLRRAAATGHPYFRVPTRDAALEDDRGGWPVQRGWFDELRQPVDGVQQRVTAGRDGRDVRPADGFDFLDDLRYSKEIKLEEFSRRGIFSRLMETVSAFMSRLL